MLPPIARLCEPIEGTSTSALADRLGLDGAKFSRGAGGGGDDDGAALVDFVPMAKMDDAEKFKGTEPWTVPCARCGAEAPFRGAVCYALGSAAQGSAAGGAAGGEGGVRSGLACGGGGGVGGCGAELFGSANPAQCFAKLSNLLSLRVRADVGRYYNHWLMCDDSACLFRTQQQSVVGNVCLRRGCTGRLQPEFGEKALYASLK